MALSNQGDAGLTQRENALDVAQNPHAKSWELRALRKPEAMSADLEIPVSILRSGNGRAHGESSIPQQLKQFREDWYRKVGSPSDHSPHCSGGARTAATHTPLTSLVWFDFG